MTATADKLTQKDILSKLALKKLQTFLSSFNRTNIQYFVEPKQNSYQRLFLHFLSGHEEESGIIYTLSRQSTEDLAARLEAAGYAAKPYHAGLERQVRQQHQELFYSYADVRKLKGFAEVNNIAEQTRIMLKKLDQMAEFCQIQFFACKSD